MTLPANRLFAALTLVLAGCASQPSEQTVFTGRAAVPHPEALFDVAPRGDRLHANNPRYGQPYGTPYCPRLTDLKPYGALMAESVASLGGPGKAEYSRAPRLFARELTTSAYRTLLDFDMTRARQDIDALRAHASANAWIATQPSNSSAGAAIEGLGALLPGWQILRQTSVATPDDRALIDGWLARVSQFTDLHTGANNIATQRGTNDMLVGLMLGDDARYQKGLQTGFMAQLRAMRPDGSFPLEVERGRKALEYTARNVGLMVYAAQIGLSQGIDLYRTEVDGKSLDDAVSFLVRSLDDNSVVDAYARADNNLSAGTPPFAPNAQVNPFEGSSSRGWVKLYTLHNPDTELSKALLAKIDPGRRIYSDTAGGSVSCYATPL